MIDNEIIEHINRYYGMSYKTEVEYANVSTMNSYGTHRYPVSSTTSIRIPTAQFEELIRDATIGIKSSQETVLREKNEAARLAYEHYRTVLALVG